MKRPDKKAIPAEFPRIPALPDIDEAEKMCPHDGTALKVIGHESASAPVRESKTVDVPLGDASRNAYEQRVVAYADILGWRNACNNISKFPRLRTAAQAIADHARNFSSGVKETLKGTVGASPAVVEQHGAVEFSFFSDNFAISVPPGQAELLFTILAWVSRRLLHAGFLVRGGIALGYLHHDPNVIFGPALIEAVELEREAIYPRLLCSARLREFLADQTYKDSVVIQDDVELVVNIAPGTALALSDLEKTVEKELKTLEKYSKEWKKWSYLQNRLPLMYRGKTLHS